MRVVLSPAVLAGTVIVLWAASFDGAAKAASAPAKAAQCTPCHGPAGLSQIPNAPNIAGQPEMYIVTSLEAYRSGARQDEMMSVIAKTLNDDDIAALAAWYAAIEITATLPPP